VFGNGIRLSESESDKRLFFVVAHLDPRMTADGTDHPG